VPIMKGPPGNQVVVGEIDIDSDAPAAFGDWDRRLLEEIAALVAESLPEE
jgi:putative methionine-R-sulfoxide reductase with GAF domain